MGSLIVWNIITVDGYFDTDKSWELPWHESLWSEDLEEYSVDQLKAADALLFGRKTYEGMADYWKKEVGTIAKYMNSLPKFVVSGKLCRADWNNSTIIGKDIIKQISILKNSFQKDIYIFGSANLLQTLIKDGLIDEYRIGIAPHIHGSGNLLFKPGLPEQNLKLMEIKRVKNDGIIIIYKTNKY